MKLDEKYRSISGVFGVKLAFGYKLNFLIWFSPIASMILQPSSEYGLEIMQHLAEMILQLDGGGRSNTPTFPVLVYIVAVQYTHHISVM